jgi:hypothetical protein
MSLDQTLLLALANAVSEDCLEGRPVAVLTIAQIRGGLTKTFAALHDVPAPVGEAMAHTLMEAVLGQHRKVACPCERCDALEARLVAAVAALHPAVAPAQAAFLTAELQPGAKPS